MVKLCVNNGNGKTIFTEGKVYEFIDGKITTANGIEFPVHGNISSFNEWQASSIAKWIEVKE